MTAHTRATTRCRRSRPAAARSSDFVLSEIQRRALGPDGKALGTTQLDESRVMAAGQCARLVLGAMEHRRRLPFTSLRGRLGRWARLVAPGLVDRIALRAVVRGH